MKMMRSMALVASVLAVSACSGFDKMDEVKAINDANPVGNAFTQSLAGEYKNFVNSELQSFKDHADALHFSRKGLAAARGDMVTPEQVSDWDVKDGHAEEMIVSRSRLVNVMTLGSRETQPQLSAVAQARFDCWIEEQEENFQQDAISSCKSQFMDALTQLESAMPAAPAPAPEPVVQPTTAFDVNPAEPMKVENAKYIVFFDFDQSDLNAGANSIIDAAANEAKSRQLTSINLVGHTDTSGSNDYNQKLSMKRANVVREAMVARGVNTSLISVNHRGEDELMVQTEDGVREPANRRTEVTFE